MTSRLSEQNLTKAHEDLSLRSMLKRESRTLICSFKEMSREAEFSFSYSRSHLHVWVCTGQNTLLLKGPRVQVTFSLLGHPFSLSGRVGQHRRQARDEKASWPPPHITHRHKTQPVQGLSYPKHPKTLRFWDVLLFSFFLLLLAAGGLGESWTQMF